MFEDTELVGLCEEGLNKQLQRTRDGATEASRIQELAGVEFEMEKGCHSLLSSIQRHNVIARIIYPCMTCSPGEAPEEVCERAHGPCGHLR